MILLPVDNSDASEKALDWAISNIYKEGDEVRLLNIVPMPTPMGMPLVLDMAFPAVPMEPDEAENLKHVAEAKKFIQQRFGPKLDTQSVPYKATIVHFLADNDSIGEAICKQAQNLNAAAVIMSKHQRGMLSDFFLGSVTKYCTQHCKSPLVVLH